MPRRHARSHRCSRRRAAGWTQGPWRAGLAALALACLLARLAPAQQADDPLQGLPIAQITIEGLQRVDEQLVRNQIRAVVGSPYEPDVVRQDLHRLTRLGQFRSVEARAHVQADRSVKLVYALSEQRIVSEIQVVGNRLISDQELLAAVQVRRGLPPEESRVERSRRQMEELYRKRGHYLTTVRVDPSQLEQSGVLIFRVIEGPRVKVMGLEFDGNQAFTDAQLKAEVKLRTAIPFLRAGVLDDDLLRQDEARLDRFHKERGYLDVRVGHQVDLSNDEREAKVTYLLSEGPRYAVRSVTVVDAITGGPPRVFAPEQLAAMLEIKPGDIYSQDLVDKSRDVVRDAYARLGYLSDNLNRVEARALHVAGAHEVDLVVEVDEGRFAKVGLVTIKGNHLTKENVVRREVRLEPGRPFDGTEIEESRRRLLRTRLFGDVRVTVLDPDPVEPEYRDVLVEVEERNTGAINFGVAVGSDAGLFGDFSLTQNNFDVADFPESAGELFRGAAFRGAGQRFAMTFRPGNEIFLYSVSLTEPHIFETDNSLSVLGQFRAREFQEYDEERVTGSAEIGRRLGDIWEVGLRTRTDRVRLDDIEPDAPSEIFLDAGPDELYALGLRLQRTTVGTFTRPGSGTHLAIDFDNVGVLGGDISFNRLSVEHTAFFTVAEDFLGRRSILRLNSRIGYIFGGRSPTYERFYLGGRSFRGFDFRTVSPKGIRADTGGPTDEPVGGEWLVFAGAQYEVPLLQETITGVLFLDSGTVEERVALDDYRVSIGAGVRLYIPQLGPVPIAVDFGFPLIKGPGDEKQLVSFSAELPF
jgi:outer membrane protein insertion porin family